MCFCDLEEEQWKKQKMGLTVDIITILSRVCIRKDSKDGLKIIGIVVIGSLTSRSRQHSREI